MAKADGEVLLLCPRRCRFLEEETRATPLLSLPEPSSPTWQLAQAVSHHVWSPPIELKEAFAMRGRSLEGS